MHFYSTRKTHSRELEFKAGVPVTVLLEFPISLAERPHAAGLLHRAGQRLAAVLHRQDLPPAVGKGVIKLTVRWNVERLYVERLYEE